MYRWFWLCLLLAACTAVPSTAVADPSNGAITLVQAQQADAPAIAPSLGGLVAVWVGSDARGVHQDARRLSDDQLGDVVTLPLPPRHPYDQRLIAGAGGRLQLLWLDADPAGQTNLYAALIAPDLQVERGPISVSEGLALRYSAVTDGAGGLWVAWDGGAIGERNVTLRYIDADGRPLQTALIAENADNPALLRDAAGVVWCFWLADGQLMLQRVDSSGEAAATAAADQPESPRALTGAINLAPGDRLIDTGAALDTSSAYYYWNVTRANGSAETWITAGALTAAAWKQPERLRVEAESAVLSWFAPLVGQQEMLTAAVQGADGVNLLSLHAGVVKDSKLLLPGVKLIGLPALIEDEAGALYLSWSAPGDSMADLQVLRIAP